MNHRQYKVVLLLLFFAFLDEFNGARSSFAQQQDPPAAIEQTEEDLTYANEGSPANVILLQLNCATAYDDNVFGNNQHRASDELFEGGGTVGIRTQRPRFNFSLDYSPEALIYRHTQGFNRANQDVRIGGTWRAAPHLFIKVKDTTAYTTGIFFASPNASFRPAIGPPPSLNSSVFTPLARSFSNQAKLDVIGEFSRRTRVDLFGNFESRNFSGESGPNLLNTTGGSGGMDVSHRMSRSVTLGTTYVYQNLRFGSVARDQIHSGFLTLGWDMTPRLNVSAYGGPQYLALNESPNPTSAGSTGRRNRWSEAGGGTITWRSPRTALQVSAQRSVTDGGGLLTAVTNTREGLDARQHLFTRWDLLVTAGNARSASILGSFGNGILKDQTAGASLEYRLYKTLTAQLGYNFIRQRISGRIPFLANMDRDYVSFGLFFQPAEIPFGR